MPKKPIDTPVSRDDLMDEADLQDLPYIPDSSLRESIKKDLTMLDEEHKALKLAKDFSKNSQRPKSPPPSPTVTSTDSELNFSLTSPDGFLSRHAPAPPMPPVKRPRAGGVNMNDLLTSEEIKVLINASTNATLTKQECCQILELYRDWDVEQCSISFELDDVRDPSDDVYDARRDLLVKVYNKLGELTKC